MNIIPGSGACVISAVGHERNTSKVSASGQSSFILVLIFHKVCRSHSDMENPRTATNTDADRINFLGLKRATRNNLMGK